VTRVAQGAQVAVRRDDQAARRADLGTAEAGSADLVGTPALVIPGGREDFKRPGDVQGLHAIEQDDQYRSHASSLAAADHGSNDEKPTNPATPCPESRHRRRPFHDQEAF